MKYLFHVCLILIIVYACSCTSGEDFYELLKISRDATVKEIRKAFKSLAIKLHPDKNKEDPDAEKKFIKITKAYEVLRDPSKRKHYDVHGDTEFDNFKQTYHSYKFYTEQFGIYDDDPLIVTLSKNDYEINVLDDSQPWFVNFYSPYCHHCHELAPTWRQLAQELEGIVRFAAVNCDDDYPLCYSLGIESYPTLLYYEKEAHMYEGQRYYDRRNVESLRKYVLEKIKIEVKEIDKTEWDLVNNRSWVLMMCSDDYSDCPEENTRKKIAATLEGLISTGVVRESFSKEFSVGSGIILWKVEKDVHNVYAIDGSDYKEIVDKVLQYLPDPKTLDEKDFSEIRKELRSDINAEAWLICFYLGAARDLNLQLKRLPTLMSNINIEKERVNANEKDATISDIPTNLSTPELNNKLEFFEEPEQQKPKSQMKPTERIMLPEGLMSTAKRVAFSIVQYSLFRWIRYILNNFSIVVTFLEDIGYYPTVQRFLESAQYTCGLS